MKAEWERRLCVKCEGVGTLKGTRMRVGLHYTHDTRRRATCRECQGRGVIEIRVCKEHLEAET